MTVTDPLIESDPVDTYRWATVEAVNPLSIRLDGDTLPLPMVPECLALVESGNRVWVQLYGRRVIVLGSNTISIAEPGSTFTAYKHIQSAPLAVWDIYHTLAFFPNVMVVDSSGTRVFGDEQVVGPSHIRITFSATFSGTAYLS